MFLLTLLVAITNLALGYATAVYLGWARLPQLRKAAPHAEPSPASHGHGH